MPSYINACSILYMSVYMYAHRNTHMHQRLKWRCFATFGFSSLWTQSTDLVIVAVFAGAIARCMLTLARKHWCVDSKKLKEKKQLPTYRVWTIASNLTDRPMCCCCCCCCLCHLIDPLIRYTNTSKSWPECALSSVLPPCILYTSLY